MSQLSKKIYHLNYFLYKAGSELHPHFHIFAFLWKQNKKKNEVLQSKKIKGQTENSLNVEARNLPIIIFYMLISFVFPETNIQVYLSQIKIGNKGCT